MRYERDITAARRRYGLRRFVMAAFTQHDVDQAYAQGFTDGVIDGLPFLGDPPPVRQRGNKPIHNDESTARRRVDRNRTANTHQRDEQGEP